MSEAPRRKTEAFEVIEVDLATGRPKIVRRHDLVTNDQGLVEFKNGYRQEGVVQHEYDPLARLKGDSDGRDRELRPADGRAGDGDVRSGPKTRIARYRMCLPALRTAFARLRWWRSPLSAEGLRERIAGEVNELIAREAEPDVGWHRTMTEFMNKL